MISWVTIHVIALLSGLGFVATLRANGALGGALSRGFVGGSASIFTKGMLAGWYPVESFFNACLNGTIGIPGYLFVLALGYLGTVWTINLFTIRRLVQ